MSSQRWAVPLAWLALFAAQLFLSLRLRDNDSVRSGESVAATTAEQAGVRKWDPRLPRILSFGFLPMVIDWRWIQTLLDPAMSRLPRGVHPSLYYELDLVTELDPAFFEVYYTGSQLLAIVRDDVVGARDLLLKADRYRKNELPKQSEEFRTRFWNGGWYLSLTLAYVHLFELGDMPRAAEAFQEAAAQPGAPEYLQKLSERLSKPGGQYEVGLRLLNFMIAQATDDKVKRRLEGQRQSLYVSQYVFDLNHSFDEYRKRFPRAPESSRAWEQYRRDNGLSRAEDPWGGKLMLGPDGRIATSTPHEKVFGLE
ncbi:MAG: hypothetical protein NDJ89_01645 [Oligoflexia bacterium]|nr:hypothetical protein [Oligoflexia bacterium]